MGRPRKVYTDNVYGLPPYGHPGPRRPQRERMTPTTHLPHVPADQLAGLPHDGALLAQITTRTAIPVCARCAFEDALSTSQWRDMRADGFVFFKARNGWLRVDECLLCKRKTREI